MVVGHWAVRSSTSSSFSVARMASEMLWYFIGSHCRLDMMKRASASGVDVGTVILNACLNDWISADVVNFWLRGVESMSLGRSSSSMGVMVVLEKSQFFVDGCIFRVWRFSMSMMN